MTDKPKSTAVPNSKQRPRRRGMIVDQRKCIGCHSCTIACKSENNVPLGYWRSWVKGIQRGAFPDVGNFFLRRLCNHCDVPPCVQVCPVQATVRREEDGIVVMYYGKCIGCGMCIGACPYDARFFNPIGNTADKCDFCVSRTDKGLLPACVEACVSGALTFGDLDDPKSEISIKLSQVGATVLKPELGTRPKVFYIAADNSLVGRIRYSDDWKQEILEYHEHIPSPDASYWKKGKKR
jgi:tetrathionate reductase subunit B